MRDHRRITKKVKEEMVKEFKKARSIKGNGDVLCGPKGGSIDQSVCIVQQIRNAAGCIGCRHNGG